MLIGEGVDYLEIKYYIYISLFQITIGVFLFLGVFHGGVTTGTYVELSSSSHDSSSSSGVFFHHGFSGGTYVG
jgi:hypothetical protein